jgi:hypothetical protein
MRVSIRPPDLLDSEPQLRVYQIYPPQIELSPSLIERSGANPSRFHQVRPVLPRLSCSNETVRNAPKHEFWVQWSGSGAFVAKNPNATLFSELGR